MGFGDLKTSAGLTALNTYLEDKSYIEGFVPSQADKVVFEGLAGAPKAEYANALRWYNQIASYGVNRSKFPGVPKALSAYGTAATAAANNADDDDDDDDDIDLFGSDDDDAAEVEKLKQERLAANAEKAKPKKGGPIAKSNIIFDVKPWGDETDLGEMEKFVRSITMDGLLWGSSKLEPIGYGIKKLRIACVVEDEKVSTDDLEDTMTANDDLIQSVDIYAFNKV